MFNTTTKSEMPIGVSINDLNAEIKTQMLIAETKRSNYPIKFKTIETFLCFLLIKPFCFISSIEQLLVSSIFFLIYVLDSYFFSHIYL